MQNESNLKNEEFLHEVPEKKYLFYRLSSTSAPEKYRYVGVTTQPLKNRMYKHRHSAKNEKKRSQPVHKWMWSQYEKGFDIIIEKIDECNEKEWENREISLISNYKEKGYDLLNIQKGGVGVITKEMRDICGIQRSADAHKKKVVQLDMDGKYVKTWDSLKSINEFFGLKSKSAISNTLNGRSKSSCGFRWIYLEDYENNTYVLKEQKIPNSFKYYKYNKDTLELVDTFNTAKSAFISVNPESENSKKPNTKTLNECSRTKTQYKGYYWCREENKDFSDYYDNSFNYYVFDEVGNLVAKPENLEDLGKVVGMYGTKVCTELKKSNIINNYKIIKNSREFQKEINKKIKI